MLAERRIEKLALVLLHSVPHDVFYVLSSESE